MLGVACRSGVSYEIRARISRPFPSKSFLLRLEQSRIDYDFTFYVALLGGLVFVFSRSRFRKRRWSSCFGRFSCRLMPLDEWSASCVMHSFETKAGVNWDASSYLFDSFFWWLIFLANGWRHVLLPQVVENFGLNTALYQLFFLQTKLVRRIRLK